MRKWRRSKIRRVAGTAASATLGYIAGGRKGALFAGRAAWRGLGRSFKPTGARVGRHRVMAPATARSTRRRRRRTFGKGDSQVSVSRAWTSRRRFKMARGFKKMLGTRYIRSLVSDRIELLQGGIQTVTDLSLFTNANGGGLVVPYVMGFADTEAMAGNIQLDDAVNPAVNLITRKWKIQSLKLETRIKNMTNVPIQIRLYDIVSRRDDEGQAPTPREAWIQGLSEQTTTIPLQGSITFPGAEPYESGHFCQRFAIVKRSMFHLGAGSEHVHVIKGRPPWLNDRSITSKYTSLGRRTRWLLMVVEGGVTDNYPPEGGGDTAVNYSRHAVDVITEYKVKFFALEKSRALYQNFSNLFSLDGQENTITEDADESTPVVIA